MKLPADQRTMLAAVYAALADPGPDERALLTSVTRLTRSVFDAAASSVLLLDQSTSELVFEAVSGEGEEFLVGTRFPAGRGIAGWVLATGEPMAIDDLADSQLFARDIAESTRYIPGSIMAVPVAWDDQVLGVIEVLDPRRQAVSMADLDLLMMIAAQAGLSLQSLITGRGARQEVISHGAEYLRLAALMRLLTELQPETRAAGLRLFESLYELVIGLAAPGELR